MPTETTEKTNQADFVSEHVAAVIESLPEPDEDAIQAAADIREESAAETAAPTGGNPGAFDPAIHAVNSSGEPIRTKSGGFRRKPGRKKNAQQTATNGPATESTSALGNEIAAQSMVFMLVTAGVSIGGPAFKPMEGESENLQKAFVRYFERTGTIVLPPWVELGVAVGMFALPRLMLPEVQDRFLSLVGIRKNAHPNNRNDINGQNQTSQTDSVKVSV